MKEKPLASPSAVAVLETPHYYLTEGRPTIPGKLAYSGRIQLFGGHMDPDEAPEDTITRELSEELDLRLHINPALFWNGFVDSEFRDGTPAVRNVSLFHIPLDSDSQPILKVPGRLVYIPKTLETLYEFEGRLTDFAFRALRSVQNRAMTLES